MNKKEEFLQKLLRYYRNSYNIEESYGIKGDIYDAYAFCDITNAKYVLMKKAELWRAICYEHVFFRLFSEISEDFLEQFVHTTKEYIEPVLVRKNEKTMEKDHMYTYVTAICVCEEGVSKDVIKKLRSTKFFKNYSFTFRGYCELRVIVVDLANQKVYGNPAARDLIKDYKKFL